MKEVILSEQNYSDAAKAVLQNWMTELDTQAFLPEIFSDGFRDKVLGESRKIIRRKERIQKVLAAAAVLLILGNVFFWSVDTPVRAAAITWVKEVISENSVFYRFFGKAEEGLPEIEVTAPEGMTLVDSTRTEKYAGFIFQDETGELVLILEYSLMDEDSHVFIDSPESSRLKMEEVAVGPCIVECYREENDDTGSYVWIDEKRGLLFDISSNLEKEVILAFIRKMNQI